MGLLLYLIIFITGCNNLLWKCVSSVLKMLVKLLQFLEVHHATWCRILTSNSLAHLPPISMRHLIPFIPVIPWFRRFLDMVLRWFDVQSRSGSSLRQTIFRLNSFCPTNRNSFNRCWSFTASCVCAAIHRKVKHSVVHSERLHILLWREYYSNDHLSYGGGTSV